MSSLPVVGQCLSDNFDFFCCWKNIGVCVGTYFCFCNTAGHVAAQKGKNCCLYGTASLLPVVSCYTRATVRTDAMGHQLWENFLIHCFCPFCALTQEARKTGTSCSDLLNVTKCVSSGQQAMK